MPSVYSITSSNTSGAEPSEAKTMFSSEVSMPSLYRGGVVDDCVQAARPAIVTALNPLNAKLYVNQRGEADGTVKPKHAFMWSVTESKGQMYGYLEDTVQLQLFAQNTFDLQEMENAIEFLDNYHAPSYGNARYPRYEFESKTRLPEGGGRWQTTLLYSVRYTDARKWAD